MKQQAAYSNRSLYRRAIHLKYGSFFANLSAFFIFKFRSLTALFLFGFFVQNQFIFAASENRCSELFQPPIAQSNKFQSIYSNLFRIHHEYRSYKEFWNHQEQLAQSLFSATIPDWQKRSRFSLSDLDLAASQNRERNFGEMIKILPLLVARFDMNAAEIVHYFLTRSPGIAKNFFNSAFLRSVSLWAEGEFGQKNLEFVVQNARKVRLQFLLQFALNPQALKDLYVARILKNNRIRTAADTSQVFLTSTTESYLEILSNLPLHEIPEHIRQTIDLFWLKMSKYPPLQSDHIANGVLGLRRFGDCPVRCATFQSTLIHPFFPEMGPLKTENDNISLTGHAGEVAILKLKGRVLGVVKFKGESSFLALRTVVDSNGHVVMAMGGVYALEGKLLDRIIELKKHQPLWTEVEVDQLVIEPQSFFFNAVANIDQFLVEPLAADDFISPEHQRLAWEKFLDLIQTIRQRLESGDR